MKKHFLKIISFLFVFIACISFITGCEEQTIPLLGDVHKHADFKVYLNGKAVDFAKEKYMSEVPTQDENGFKNNGHYLNAFFHLHDMDGGIIHQHMSGVKLGEFFESLGMQFTPECFALDDGSKYCNDGEKTLKMYVNGEKNSQFGEYEFNDLDQILITYGNETEDKIKEQIASVGDEACIQSETCPERGHPHDESSCLSSSNDCIAPIN